MDAEEKKQFHADYAKIALDAYETKEEAHNALLDHIAETYRITGDSLTDEELAINHVIDLAQYYHVDILGFGELGRAKQIYIAEQMAGYKADGSADKDTLRAVYLDSLQGDGSLQWKEDAMKFVGYSARLTGYAGLRGEFSMDMDAVKQIEEAGCSVEFGVIMALRVDADGNERSYGDAVLRAGDTGYKVAISNAIKAQTYSTGEANDGFGDAKHWTGDDGLEHFVYAVTFKNYESAAADDAKALLAYSSDMIYRGYVLITDATGGTVPFYLSATGNTFKNPPSLYELSAYLHYELEKTSSVLTRVIEMVGKTEDVIAIYDYYKQLSDAFYAEGAGDDAVTMLEWRRLYNYRKNAQNDRLLGLKAKYYMVEGASEPLDLIAEITNLIDAAETKQGTPFTKDFENVDTSAGETFYIEVLTYLGDVTDDQVDMDSLVSVGAEAITLQDLKDYPYLVFEFKLRGKDSKSYATFGGVKNQYFIDGVDKVAQPNSSNSGKTLGHMTVNEFGDTWYGTVPTSEFLASSFVIKENDVAVSTQGIVLSMQVTALDEKNNVIEAQEKASGTSHNTWIGAVVDLQNLKATAKKPDDFAAFWQSQFDRLWAIDPTDTAYTEYTGVVETELQDTAHKDYFDYNIEEENYFHATLMNEEMFLDYLAKGLLSSSWAGKWTEYEKQYAVYEVYLKSAGPVGSAFVISFPKNTDGTLKTNLPVSMSYDGYSVGAPTVSNSSDSIAIHQNHSSYHLGRDMTKNADGTWKDAYYETARNAMLSIYGKNLTGADPAMTSTSTFTDKEDNYILYMFLRNLQTLRFVATPEFVSKLATATNAPIGESAFDFTDVWSGDVRIGGSSMGGYQSLGQAALISMAKASGMEGLENVHITRTAVDFPAWCNLGGANGGRMDDMFSIGYQANMCYFDNVFFAEYIEADLVRMGRCGLGDYICPPSGVLATYNALHCNKWIQVVQNTTHGYTLSNNTSEKDENGYTVIHYWNYDQILKKDAVTEDYTAVNLPIRLSDLSEQYATTLDVKDGYDAEKNASINQSVLARFQRSMQELPKVDVLERVDVANYPVSMQNAVYVSAAAPSGGDGTLQNPYNSLQTAVNAMKGRAGGVVWVMGGTYTLKETVSIPRTVSGRLDSPIFIQSYDAQEVVLRAGTTLDPSDFQAVSSSDTVAGRIPEAARAQVLCLDLTTLGWTSEDYGELSKDASPALYINAEKATLARYPNDDEDMSKALLYFDTVYETGSVTSRDGSNLYAAWIARVQSGEFDASHSESDFYTDSYGNRNLDYGWVVGLVDDEPAQWVDTGNIWYYGNVFEGWEYDAYNVTIRKDEMKLESKSGSTYGAKVSGNSPTGYNNYYLYNAIEALDAPGEWFLDRDTGMLYVYPTEDFATADIRYCAKQFDLISISGAEHIVIDGLTFRQAEGIGVKASSGDHIVVQNCVFSDLRDSGIQFHGCVRSAVLYNDLSQINGTMINVVASSTVRNRLYATQNIVQNNYCHDPLPSRQGGISLQGIMSVASHNYLVDTQIGLGNAYECIVEYNDLSGGSRDTSDAGMIYLTQYYNLGNHIRYNYLHSMNVPGNAVYFDDLSSGNYMYYNIIDSTERAEGKAIGFGYTSSGHFNVFFGNLCVGRSVDRFNESYLYFDDSSHLGYRFAGFSAKMEEIYQNKMQQDSLRRRFPGWTAYVDLMSEHIAERSEDGYVRNELEIYLRFAANNIFKNNVILGTNVAVNQPIGSLKNSVTGEAMIARDLVETNYHSTDYHEVLTDFAGGDFRISSAKLSEVQTALAGDDFAQWDVSQAGPLTDWWLNP